MFGEISYVEDGAIARITINRPQVRNALKTAPTTRCGRPSSRSATTRGCASPC